MSDDLLLYLSADIRTAGLPMRELVAALERAFDDLGAGRAEVPEDRRPSLRHLLLPRHAGALARGRGGRREVGRLLPRKSLARSASISALLVLSEPSTGRPLTVMDGRWLTVRRTAACSALSARFLARSGARSLGVLGCGLQARAHVEAFRELLPLARVKAFDRHPDRARAFAEDLRREHGLEASAHDTVREVVEGMDVVLTAGAISTSTTRPSPPAGSLRGRSPAAWTTPVRGAPPRSGRWTWCARTTGPSWRRRGGRGRWPGFLRCTRTSRSW